MKEFLPPPAEPFFLKTESGECFCLYYAPHPDRPYFGAFIYIHPFADEMNKSRRMAALQTRALATMGYGVLQIDLLGCGDSSGEFRDAHWNIWKQNISSAKQWLESHTSVPISLWGLRLGAILALDFAKNSEDTIDKIILWKPIINGKSFLTQFLRLQLANKILVANDKTTHSVQTIRDSLAAGTTVEIAGYELTPNLATAIDNIKMADMSVMNSTIHWFEIVAEVNSSITPSVEKVIKAWEQKGNPVQVHLVPGIQFWTTQEITICPELISATSEQFAVSVS